MLFEAMYCLRRPEQAGWLIRQSLVATICGYGSLWVKRVESNLKGFCYILARPNVLYIKGMKSSTIAIGATKTKKTKNYVPNRKIYLNYVSN
jgi:hypothetical protein